MQKADLKCNRHSFIKYVNELKQGINAVMLCEKV